MNKVIPLSVPNFEGNEKKYVDDAVEKVWVSTGGAYVNQFEKNLADFLHTDNVCVCQSGTSALHLSLVQAGVTLGDCVLVPPVTFIAAVNPVKYQFATPIFIDCDDSLCIDPIKLRKFCEEKCEFKEGFLKYNGHTVKAVVVVHVFGNLADMEAIMDIAKQYHLTVIEDATEAIGSYFTTGKFKGKYAGTIGDFGAYSFNGNKIITTGGGGAITSNKAANVDHMRFLSTQAKTDPHAYIHDEIGYNYRMTNVQAALGVAQLEELPDFIQRKQENYELYKQLFSEFNLCSLLPFREGTSSNKWFYSLVINRDLIKTPLTEIMLQLKNEGIETRAIWGLINEQLPYLKDESFEIEKGPYYADRVLNIPCSTQITREEIEYVAKTIKQVLLELKTC